MSKSKTKKPPPYFDYEPLQDGWIRLVAVQKANDASEIEEQLKIHFFISPLSTCPPYTALSYTWGDPSPNIDPCMAVFTKVLRCYPILSQDRIILASRSLRDALRRIRQYQTWRANREETFGRYNEPNWKILLESAYGATTYFWIDALCIDQEDLNERSQQVSLMGRIYMQASHTMIWLGESDEYTEAAQSFLGKVAQNAGVEVSTSTDHISPSNQQVQKYMGLNHLDIDEQIAFMAMMSRNWFFRMWVLQESVLSSRLGVLLGSLCFNFQLLLHAANVECVNNPDFSFAKTAVAAATRYPGLASSVLSERTLNSISKLVFTGHCQEKIASGHLPDFLSIVASSRSLIATDPRDKIYALLGIVSEFQSDNVSIIVPDYTKEIERVFVEMTYSVMQARNDLAVLSLSSPEVTTANLPSWCPDYSSSGRVLRVFGDMGNAWRSGATWTHPPKFGLLPNMSLRVEGTRVDVVVESACIGLEPLRLSKANDPSRLKFGIAEMCALALKLDLSKLRKDLPNLPSRVQILWRTIIFDELQGVSPVGVEVGALFPEFVKWLLMATIAHHLKMKDPKDLNLLSEVELHSYIEKLIFSLEQLVALEPQDGTLVPDSTELRDLFETSLACRSINSEDSESSTDLEDLALDQVLLMKMPPPQHDASESSTWNLPSFNARNQSSNTNSRGSLEKSFVSAFFPLMKATMARLRHFTLGLTQASVIPLDEVWILQGAHAPVFLRPTCHGRYQFLGEAYVHGIMHGEVTSFYGTFTSIVLE